MSYDGSKGGDDQWERTAQLILMLSQLRGGATESQINTQEPVSVRLRFGLPLLNALSVALAFVLALLGVFLMTWGFAWMLDLEWDVRSWLVAWVLLVVVAWLVAAGVKKFLKNSVRIVQAFAAVGVMLVAFLVFGSLLLTARERFGLELASMVIGAGLILGCVGWGYNQASELVRGYWRQSPFETAIIKELLPLFKFVMGSGAQSQPDVRVEDPRYLLRGGNGIVARPVAPQRRDTWEGDDEEETELVTIDPETGNLIWFARFAARLPTLSIRDLTVRPAPLLPFREDGKELRLRRAMIRRLLVRGSTEDEEYPVDGVKERGLGVGGFWELRGQGATPEWVKPRDQVMRETERMWKHVYGDKTLLPDYWDELNETRRAA